MRLSVAPELGGADAVEIKIEDQGIGIAVEDQPKLFVPFERLGTVSGVSGAGLGLNVCLRLVEAHGLGHVQINHLVGTDEYAYDFV